MEDVEQSLPWVCDYCGYEGDAGEYAMEHSDDEHGYAFCDQECLNAWRNKQIA